MGIEGEFCGTLQARWLAAVDVGGCHDMILNRYVLLSFALSRLLACLL